MLFVVIGHGVDNLDFSDPKVANAAVRSHMRREGLVKEGKIIVHGHIVGHKGHVWVYNVESLDELDRLMTEDPMYAYLQKDPTIYPIISPQRALELERQFFGNLREEIK